MCKAYFHYLLCENRTFYKQLAKKYGTTGWRAYRIAQGKNSRTFKEYLIFLELHRKGIIS